MRKRLVGIVLALALVCTFLPWHAHAADFTPDPQTAYATQFVSECEGQQWFINEVERLLNAEQKSINTIASNADLDRITSLGFANRNITGHIPTAIKEFTELRYLFLSGNQLSGSIPAGLFLLPKLENIGLGQNAYTGPIPTGFGTMPSLKILDLRENGWTGTIPADILADTTLTFLDVSSNKLSGPIPTGLNAMTGLTYLAISVNDWTAGPLVDLSALTSLKTLSAWDCNLTGEIPSYLYNLTTLQVLDLDTNGFVGEISDALGNLQDLQLLSIGSNQIEGTVPDSLGALSSLTTLDISNNKLRGTLPPSVAEIDLVYAQNNYMTGDVLKGLENNSGNFCDGASTAQYQLSSSAATITISKTGRTNLYSYLRNTGTGAKPLLEADRYVVTDNTGHRITLTQDEIGIYVQALGDILKSDKATVTIQILDNDGSARSTVTLTLTTEATGSTPAGGGGGGGSTPPPVDPGTDEPVETVTHVPYIQGFTDNTFRPNDSVTREQVAAMVVRAFESEWAQPMESAYTDVAADRWSAGYIEWSRTAGYLQGYEDGTFRPDKPMTRAELAACLVRITESRGTASSGAARSFSDVNGSEWYAEYVSKASALGLITGYTDGTFRPNANVTRAEAVTMINRMLARNPDTAPELHAMADPYTDITEQNNWAYWQIMEASLPHEHPIG